MLATKPIPTNLAFSRRVHGWSLDQLAAQAGITRSHLSRIENGYETPSALTLAKLCHAAGIDVATALDAPEVV